MITDLTIQRRLSMAYFQDGDSLTQLRDPMFDKEYGPGMSIDYPGIYKCVGCEREIAASEKFPPLDHHQHMLDQRDVRWKLIVWARELPHT